MTETAESVVRLEQALSGRSTCRATGETIGKDEWRVGLEVWISGRMSWSWQKPLPFLGRCYIEYCLHPGNLGTCRKTGHKFVRGEPRFVVMSGEKKVFLSLPAAGEELLPVLRHVGVRSFRATQLEGAAGLAAGEREAFFKAFQVPKAEAARFNKEQPPPPPPSLEAPAGPRPAKRARTATGAVLQGQGVGEGCVGEAADEKEGPKGSPGQGEEAMTEYERQRAEQIRRNRERMMALDLPALAAELAEAERKPKPAAAAKPKGLSTRKQRLSEVLPRRASLRVQGKAPDGSQVHSETRGEIVIVSGEAIRFNPAHAKQEVAPAERHLKGELPFKSTSADAATDAQFLALLACAAAQPVGGGAGGAGGGSAERLGAGRLGRLRLADADVAKVTRGGVTHLAFHPSAETLLLACADKYGHLGLWHVNYESESPSKSQRAQRGQQAQQGQQQQEEGEEGVPGAGEGAEAATQEGAVDLDGSGEGEAGGTGNRGSAASEFDGVLEFKHHMEYISGLRWANGGQRLFTGSYDGSLRALDLGSGSGISLLTFDDEDSEFSAMDVTADGSTAVLGDNEGGAHVVDLRAGKRAMPALTIHKRKVNTVHLEPSSEQVLATASTDSFIHLWDIRKLGPKARPLATAQHAQTCQAAYFAPDGSCHLASTSFDDTVRVWDGASGLKPLACFKHDNQTGRWVFPFRAVWGPAADCLVVGNMKRAVDILDASSGGLRQLRGEAMTAIAARNCVHPSLPVLAAATASGRAHVYR